MGWRPSHWADCLHNKLDKRIDHHEANELMDLPTTLGAPRHCYIGGEVYWVRPMTLAGMATVMQWLDDVLPGRADRKMPPKIGDNASQAALQSFPGQTMLTWLALRDHGFSYAQAAALVPRSPDDDDNQQKAIEYVRLQDVFMARRRTMERIEGGSDWSETWLESNAARFAAEYGLKELGDLTLDQYDWLCSAGKADEFAQFDVQKAVDELPARIAAIEAARANGLLETPNG